MTPEITWFFAFSSSVLALLILDLLVFHRRSEEGSLKEAALWSVFWVALSLGFGCFVTHSLGRTKGLEFFAGYLIEYALSVDNLFVFVLIFNYFHVPAEHHRRVLFWGVIGAFFMRGTLILLGAGLVERFHWILYLLGVFLVVTGVKMVFASEEVDLERNLIVRICRRFLPITPSYHGSLFFVRAESGQRMMTMLALVVAVIEAMDLAFAVDSIPAVLAVTQDPFIAFSSNVCAVMGLRSMYFLLARVVDKVAYLKYGLAAVLSFVGLKMLIASTLPISTGLSLLIVAGLLSISVVASLLFAKRA